jgi:hypothetical protein
MRCCMGEASMTDRLGITQDTWGFVTSAQAAEYLESPGTRCGKTYQ